MITSKKLLESLTFCVIDLETTGGNHDNDQIIEIGMVKIEKLKITESKNILINPEKVIPDFIQKLTSIKQKDVKDCPTIEEVIDDVIDFIGGHIIIAHNTSFDVPFLNSVLRRLGHKELTNKVICTNVMTKHMIPEIMTSNLSYMSELFGIQHDNAHRAKDDAIAAAKLLLKYLEIFEAKGIKKVNQLYYPRNKFELDRLHFHKEQTSQEIINTISKHNCSMQITIKGPSGLILAVLPIESPVEESKIISECLESLEWEIVSINLLSPMLEGIFQFNNHFQKYPEHIRTKILNYLQSRYHCPDGIPKQYQLSNIDFLVGHHLVRNQVAVYSFLNLNTNTKNLFKIPAHKKKLMHFLNGQISRFQGTQKGRKRTLLHDQIVPLVENYLSLQASKPASRQASEQTGAIDYLQLSINDIKKRNTKVIKDLEKFVFNRSDNYLFPQNHF